MCGSVEKEYEKFFERVAGRVADSREERRLFYRVLGAFASARAPVTAEQIMAAFDLDRADWDWAFGQISQFLERGGVRQEERGAQTYRLYHETFREYLRSRLAGDLPGCHRRWADHAGGWRNLRGYARLYALRHLPAHLIAASEGPEPAWDRLCDVLTDFAYLQARVGAADVPHSGDAPATIFDLLRDFLDAQAALLRENHPRREEVKILHDILDRHSHILKENPTLLVQQVVNAREWGRIAPGGLSAKVGQAERSIKRPWLRLLNRPDGTSATGLLRTLWGRSVACVAFSPNGRTLAGCGEDGVVRLWDVQTGELLRAWKGHDSSVEHLTFSPGGGALASGGEDGAVRLWDVQTGELLRAWEGHGTARKGALVPGGVWSLAFSPDGGVLASGGRDEAVRLWDAQTGELLRALEGDDRLVWCLAFSPGGGALASTYDWAVRLWDPQTGELLRALERHSAPVKCVAFSPDGGALASGDMGGAVRLWDVQTGELLRAWKGHDSSVKYLAFSPGGALASCGDDRAVRLWEVQTGGQPRALGGLGDRMRCVAFSPDGGALASGGKEGSCGCGTRRRGSSCAPWKGTAAR
jgi:WD40 repeat protein